MATILIVDDDRDTRSLVGRYLSALGGHRSVLAADGQEALDALAKEPVDFIVLDLVMPRMGGAEFLAALAAAGRLDVPVFVCSGLDRDGLRGELARAGVTGLLRKGEGFFIDLVEAVSRHVGERSAFARLSDKSRVLPTPDQSVQATGYVHAVA